MLFGVVENREETVLLIGGQSAALEQWTLWGQTCALSSSPESRRVLTDPLHPFFRMMTEQTGRCVDAITGKISTESFHI